MERLAWMFLLGAASAGVVGDTSEMALFARSSRASFIPTSAFGELVGWGAHAADAVQVPPLVGRALLAGQAAGCDGQFVSLQQSSSGSVELYDATHGYLPYQTCYWRIKPDVSLGQITLFFTQFSVPLGAQHYVQISSVAASGAITLLRQEPSGLDASSSLPLPVICDCDEMLIKFRSTYDAGSAYAGFSVTYTALVLSVVSFTPQCGPTSGGVTIQMVGIFRGHFNRTCALAGISTELTTASDSATPDVLVNCLLSDNLGALAARYELSISAIATADNQPGSASLPGLGYYMYPDPVIASLAPSSALPFDEITVLLREPISAAVLPLNTTDLRCQFGTVVVSATAVTVAIGPDSGSLSGLRCVVPMPIDSGSAGVNVTVSLNGQSFSDALAGSGSFQYSETYCDGLDSRTNEIGSISDHTRTGLLATPYRPYSTCSWSILPDQEPDCTIVLKFTEADLAARKDHVEVFDGVDATGTLLRKFPQSASDTFSRLQTYISTGCALFVRLRTGMYTGRLGFTASYLSSSLGLLSVEPNSAAADGTTLTITGRFSIIPADANATDALLCVFTRADAEERTSNASKFSNSKMRCDVPLWEREDANATEIVSLTVRYGELESQPPISFVLTLLPNATSLQPAVGRIGQQVTVFGSHFANLPELACWFGFTMAPASWVSETELSCLAPEPTRLTQERSPSFEVRVTNNGRLGPASGLFFQYAVYCGSNATDAYALSTAVGVVVDHAAEDSSTDGTYMPSSLCHFELNPSNVNFIDVYFDVLQMGRTDTLQLTDGASTVYDALSLQSSQSNTLLALPNLPTPVSLVFSTGVLRLGSGFQLTYLEQGSLTSTCPVGGPRAGYTTTLSSLQNTATASSVSDAGWAFEKISISQSNEERTLIVSLTSDRLSSGSGLEIYILTKFCPSQLQFDQNAVVPIGNKLQLFTCTGATDSVFIGVRGTSGDGGYVPFNLQWQASTIQQLTQDSLSVLATSLTTGVFYYVKVAAQDSPLSSAALQITVRPSATFAGQYLGTVSVNAGGCGPVGSENYRILAPHPGSQLWEISIVEPTTNSGCSGSGFGGTDVPWVLAFQPDPGNDERGVAIEADYTVSVDYSAVQRAPLSGQSDSLTTVADVAPGQRHFFLLSGKPILGVSVRPCVWSSALNDFDCDTASSVTGSLSVIAQKKTGECYLEDQVSSSTTTLSTGAYRLSSCDSTVQANEQRWTVVVENDAAATYSTKYKLVASASDIFTLSNESTTQTIAVPDVFPGESKYYKIDVEDGYELDIAVRIETQDSEPLLTLIATTGDCALATLEYRDQADVNVVSKYKSDPGATAAQVYRMTLHPCQAKTYFVVVGLSSLLTNQYEFTISFERRPRSGLPSLISAGTTTRAILPNAQHLFLATVDPANLLTVRLTQAVDTNLLPVGTELSDVLSVWVQPITSDLAAPSLICSWTDIPDGAFAPLASESTINTVTRQLTIAECGSGYVMIGVSSSNQLPESFTEYTLELATESRTFDGSSLKTITATVMANQGNTFEISSTGTDNTIVVQLRIPVSDRYATGEGERAIGLQVPGVNASCEDVASSPAIYGSKILLNYVYVSNLCVASNSDVLQSYYVRVNGTGVLLDRPPATYTIDVSSQPQIDYVVTLSPTNPSSAAFALSSDTWQYNFMTVPSSTGNALTYEGRFDLSVERVLLGSQNAVALLTDFSQLGVYLAFNSCPSAEDISFAIDAFGVVTIPDDFQTRLTPKSKLYIGLRGNWQSGESYAFTVRPSFKCNLGFVSVNYSTPCSACVAGTFNPTVGASLCTRCSIGEEQPLAAQAACTKCGFGQFQAQPGQVRCNACPAGSEGTRRGAKECTKCSIGRYSPRQRSEACLQCPVSTTTNIEGAADLLRCVCNPGFYNQLLAAGEVCVACPLGALCDGGNGLDSMPYPSPGYFQDWDETLLLANTIVTQPQQTLFYLLNRVVWPYLETTQQTPRFWDSAYYLPCTPASSCLGGKWWRAYSSETANFNTNDGYLSVQCAVGYTNPQGSKQCNRCASTFYRNVSNECTGCTTNALQLIALGVGLIALAFAMYSVSKSGFNVGAIAISVNFFQVTSIFASFDIKWPLNVLNIFRFFALFQIGIDIAQPECVVPNIVYSQKWLFMMLLPVIFLGMLCTILFVINGHHALLTRTRFSLWFKRKFPQVLRKPEKKRAMPDETRVGAAARVLQGLGNSILYKSGTAIVQTSTRETREVVADSIVNAFFMFLTLFYLAAVQKALEPFSCFPTQFSSTGVASAQVMRADASIRCEWSDPVWVYLAPAGIIAAIVYGIGIPAAVLSFLFAGRFRLNVMAFGRKFGYLYRRYEREWYFWEVMVLSRKLSLAATRLFLSAHIYAQTTFGIVIITGFLSAQVFARPYAEVHLDMMETVLLSANYLTLSMGFTRQVLSQQAWYSKDQLYAVAIEGGILGLLIFCLIFIIFFNAYDVTRQLIRLYRQRSLGEGKYGAGQLLNLFNLDKHTEELQVLGQSLMQAHRREVYVSWLLQSNAEDKQLVESVFKSFKFFVEESDRRSRDDAAEKRRGLKAESMHKLSKADRYGSGSSWLSFRR